MKRIIFTLLALGSFIWANGQACGPSVSTTCTPSGTQTTYGFQDPNSITCISQGATGGTSIQFKLYETFTAQGQTVSLDGLRFDSIENLPCGLCWKTNKPGNYFDANEEGCIYIYGTTNDAAGQYKLRLKLSAKVGGVFLPQVDAEVGNIRVWVRVQAQGGSCANVDTAANANNLATSGAVCQLGITNTTLPVTDLLIVPNPISSNAQVTFVSEEAGNYTARLTDITGKEVMRREMEVRGGQNEMTIERGSLPQGVYFFTLSNGKGNITRKVSIGE
jgi:hypothetical protein